MRIRGGSGLGDSLYVQTIARHLVKQGKEVEVCSNWPEIFSQMDVKVSEFTRQNIDKICHYNRRKPEPTSQFEDCCIDAGVTGVEYTLDWEIQGQWDFPKPVLLVYMPRTPMDRKDNYGKELFPDCDVLNDIIRVIKPHFYTIQVGKGNPLYKLDNIDLDLVNKTSVTDLLDLAKLSSRLIGQISGMIPLAESFDKKCLALFSFKGLSCPDQRISSLLPRKLCHKETSLHVVDNWTPKQIEDVLATFL